MENAKRRFKKSDDVVARKIEDEIILVPLKSQTHNVDCIYSLDATGRKVWELLDGKRTVSQICDVLVDQMEVTPEEALKDLAKFLNDLESVSGVEEV